MKNVGQFRILRMGSVVLQHWGGLEIFSVARVSSPNSKTETACANSLGA